MCPAPTRPLNSDTMEFCRPFPSAPSVTIWDISNSETHALCHISGEPAFHNKYGALAASFLQRELRPWEDQRPRGRSLSFIRRGGEHMSWLPGTVPVHAYCPHIIINRASFTFQSVLVWMINHVSSLRGAGLRRADCSQGVLVSHTPCCHHTHTRPSRAR